MNTRKKYFFNQLIHNSYKRLKQRRRKNVFYNKRLDFSLENENISGKDILYIGQKNGIVFDELKSYTENYESLDISDIRITRQSIDYKRDIIFYDDNIKLSNKKFDYIFFLETNILVDKESFYTYLEIIKNCSRPGTRIIISYPIYNFINNIFRKIRSNLIRLLSLKDINKIKSQIKHAPIARVNFNRKECLNLSHKFLVYDYLYINTILPPLDYFISYKLINSIYVLIKVLIGNGRMKSISNGIIIKYQYVP